MNCICSGNQTLTKVSGLIQSETNNSCVLRFGNTFTDKLWSQNHSSSHSNNKWQHFPDPKYAKQWRIWSSYSFSVADFKTSFSARQIAKLNISGTLIATRSQRSTFRGTGRSNAQVQTLLWHSFFFLVKIKLTISYWYKLYN